MAINPPSDILLDVATAAQPAKLQAARQRLAKAGSDTAGSGFAATLEAISTGKRSAAKTSAGVKISATSAIAVNMPTPQAAPHRQQAAKTLSATSFAPGTQTKTKALEKFEAYFLQTFVESMLPKDAENVFGSGTAGDVWKSMLAEHVAAELARSAKFGIAERMAGNHFDASAQQAGAAQRSSISHSGDASLSKNLSYVQERPRSERGSAERMPASATLLPWS